MEAAIFDLDSVLTTMDEYHFESWRTVLNSYGIEVTEDARDRILGLPLRHSLEVLLDGIHLTEELLDEVLKQKNERYLNIIERMGPRDLSPGIPVLLQELHMARIRIGVASASQNVAPVLRHLGIDGFVQAFTDGILVQRSKPAPDVFLSIARVLKVAPEMCLAIEDSATGILAARNAGMVVVGLGKGSRVGGAHVIFDDLANIHLKDLQEIFSRCREIEPFSYEFKKMPQAA